MKVSPLLFSLSLTASFVAEKVSARVGTKLIERFKIVGSDSVCEKTGCSKNFNIIANKFDDGTDEGMVKGLFQNVLTDGQNQHGYVDCLNIVDDEEGNTYAIASVIFTEGNNVVPVVPGDKYFYAGKINGTTGTGYRTNPWIEDEKTGTGTDCFDDVWVNFFLNDPNGMKPFFENKGKVTIEVLK